MTKSNDKDPWIGGESTPSPEPKAEAKAEDSAEPDDAIKANEITETPETVVEPEKVDIPAEDSADTAETPEAVVDSETVDESPESDDQESDEASEDGFVPSVVPKRDRNIGEEPYHGGRGRGGSSLTYTPKSEANYVPAEPKLYVAPGMEDDDGEEKFGFPEVPENTQRLFIAIEIPRAVKRELSDLPKSFIPREYERVRWIGEEAMHLTLKFLGDVPIEQIPDIKAALEQSAESTGRFQMKIGRTGCFPSFRDPRICWVGFNGELRRLEQLQGRVEGQMVGLGLERDDRKFAAHVTVGRTRPGVRGRFAQDVGASWQHAPLKSSGKVIQVTAIALYRTYLDEQENTQYEQLANHELG
ncbi:MAG: RNA 2',3'-cyclic phosphodiesterase [Chloroflexi bacterium]|nr:RNA 2',3'-cyclic phosphodiesterase [Chloroflexota bacterium]